MLNKIYAEIERLKEDMVQTMCEMVSYPAINPTEGGTGEKAKAEYIIKKLKELGFDDVQTYNCTDAEGNERPNIVVRIPGQTQRRLWIVGHMDIVPAGDLTAWETDPFIGVVKDDKVYGRGTNDNGAAIITSLYAALAYKRLGILPKYEICLCFVANEETGSLYGIQHVIKQKIFREDDLVLVPDMMSPEGDFIEVAEKSIFWFEFDVLGKQVHASLPNTGINAARAANEFCCALDAALHNAYPETNEIFTDPAYSTFEPTRRRANVDSVNIVPGTETFAFDCRVLPGIPKAGLEKIIDEEMARTEKKFGVKMVCRYLQCDEAAPVTPVEAPVVQILAKAIKEVINAESKIAGVGGGTCGAFFRRAGIPAAVWGLGDTTEHMPNEYIKISHLTDGAKVLANMMYGAR